MNQLTGKEIGNRWSKNRKRKVMSTLHFQILHLWRHTPILYILLVTVPFLLFCLVMLKNIKNTNNTVVNVLMLIPMRMQSTIFCRR